MLKGYCDRAKKSVFQEAFNRLGMGELSRPTLFGHSRNCSSLLSEQRKYEFTIWEGKPPFLCTIAIHSVKHVTPTKKKQCDLEELLYLLPCNSVKATPSEIVSWNERCEAGGSSSDCKNSPCSKGTLQYPSDSNRDRIDICYSEDDPRAVCDCCYHCFCEDCLVASMRNNTYFDSLVLTYRKCPVCGVDFKKYIREDVSLFPSDER